MTKQLPPKARVWSTNYATSNGTFTSQLYAPDDDGLALILAKRGLGEAVLFGSFSRKPYIVHPSSLFRRARLHDALHAATFLSWIAIKSGQSADGLLGDGGVLHELVHYINFKPGCEGNGKPSFSVVDAMLRTLEHSVPGNANPYL